MVKAFVETTILTDALLKAGASGEAALAALKRYNETELPLYAVKEFKAGPMRNWVWFHNKLVTTRSFAKSLEALHRMSLTPRRHTTSTALEALAEVTSEMAQSDTKEFETGPIDQVLSERYRLAFKRRILRAWERRRSLVSRVVHPLPCYRETAPIEDVSGQIVLHQTECEGGGECEMARVLKQDPAGLTRLRNAVDAQPPKRENQTRSQALRALIRTPKRAFPAKMCRSLGDAVFAFLAPNDAVILTTNERDIGPLAAALGKNVERP